jgi:predicted MPP superfamily phosphohydrolase
VKRRPALLIFNVLIWLLAAVLVYARWIEPNRIRVVRIQTAGPGGENAGNPIRIVHISDLHIGEFGLRERSLIRKVNNLNPDLILITGDIAQYWAWTGASIKVLDSFKPTVGTFATLGDADYSNRQGHCAYCHGKSANSNMFKVLRKSTALVNVRGRRVLLAGVDDAEGPFAHVIPDIAGVAREGAKKILLLSSPGDYGGVAGKGYDLILSGDTHGGQVLSGMFSRGLDGVSGWVKGVSDPFYISPGIGTNVMSFRFAACPEVTFFEF